MDSFREQVQAAKRLRFLVEFSEDWWISSCIEFDLVTQASSLEDILFETERMVLATLAGRDELGAESGAQLVPMPPGLQATLDIFERASVKLSPVSGPLAIEGVELEFRVTDPYGRS